MAGKRRTLDRRALRDEHDAVEAREQEATEEFEEDEGDEVEEGDAEVVEVDESEEEAPAPKVKAKAKKAKAPAKPKVAKTTTKRSRAAKIVRLKAQWVIKDNSAKIVDTFEFNQKEAAEARLLEKQTDKKGAFYLELQKVPIE